MNIRQAKEQISNTITAYTSRDELGNYLIPAEKQRPVFLVGPPGIGKTAIMQQIAAELGVGLISYSMTHHTRQSAIGLPFIVHKSYGGREYDITEYTMSEIIASVYELMEDSGIREGILFLDEINCVSETLTPLMLQFLQYKVFGRHKVPDGWVIVTAGNPPEYNDSVREFDIATLDRLKKIRVEADFDAWKEYAVNAGIHQSILSFLQSKRNRFYSVENTVDGRRFVTPRGWEDLSRVIAVYEEKDLPVDEELIIQYLQDETIAREYAVYYDLYNKYRSEYPVADILQGNVPEDILTRAADAPFDETYTLIGLLLEEGKRELRKVTEDRAVLEKFRNCIRERLAGAEPDASADGASVTDTIGAMIETEQAEITSASRAGAISREEMARRQKVISMLRELSRKLTSGGAGEDPRNVINSFYRDKVSLLDRSASEAGNKLENLFSFAEKVWGEGREMLMIVTELTSDVNAVRFISAYGCESYYKHNKSLLFNERELEIDARARQLGL